MLLDPKSTSPLSVVACTVWLQLSLDETRLARWLVRLEDGYRANPYHNRIHAADVLRSAHVLLSRGGCTGAQGPDDITQLAVYLAAVSILRLL